MLALYINAYYEVPVSDRWIYFLAQQMPSFIYHHKILIGVKIFLIAISSFFALPLLLLVLVQMRNFCFAKTTYERYSRRKHRGSNSSDEVNDNEHQLLQKKAKRQNTAVNCWEMCC